MTSPATAPALGSSTFVSKWRLEVDTSATTTPTWVPVAGISNLVPTLDDASFVDDGTFEALGYGAQGKAGTGWNIAVTVSRKVVQATGTAYDAGQEFLRGKLGKIGPAATSHIRLYEYDPNGGPTEEAYVGFAATQYAHSGGGRTDPDRAVITLQGQGQILPVVHPYPHT